MPTAEEILGPRPQQTVEDILGPPPAEGPPRPSEIPGSVAYAAKQRLAGDMGASQIGQTTSLAGSLEAAKEFSPIFRRAMDASGAVAEGVKNLAGLDVGPNVMELASGRVSPGDELKRELGIASQAMAIPAGAFQVLTSPLAGAAESAARGTGVSPETAQKAGDIADVIAQNVIGFGQAAAGIPRAGVPTAEELANVARTAPGMEPGWQAKEAYDATVARQNAERTAAAEPSALQKAVGGEEMATVPPVTSPRRITVGPGPFLGKTVEDVLGPRPTEVPARPSPLARVSPVTTVAATQPEQPGSVAAFPPSAEGPPPPKYAGSINLERLRTEADVRQQILNTSRQVKQQGPVTLDSVAKAADEMGFDLPSMEKLAQQSVESRAQFLAARRVHLALQEQLASSRELYRSNPTPGNLDTLRAHQTLALRAYRAASTIASESGLQLRTYGMDVAGECA
jgi:hypothetical protein